MACATCRRSGHCTRWSSAQLACRKPIGGANRSVAAAAEPPARSRVAGRRSPSSRRTRRPPPLALAGRSLPSRRARRRRSVVGETAPARARRRTRRRRRRAGTARESRRSGARPAPRLPRSGRGARGRVPLDGFAPRHGRASGSPGGWCAAGTSGSTCQRDAIRVVALALIRLVVAALALLAREGDSDPYVSAGHLASRGVRWLTAPGKEKPRHGARSEESSACPPRAGGGESRWAAGDWRSRLRAASGGRGVIRDDVGWPGASQPPAPTDPGVKVSRHRALLIRRLVRRSCGPISSGRRGRAVDRAVRSTIAGTFGGIVVVADTSFRPSASGRH